MPKVATGSSFESRGKHYARTPLGKGKRHISPIPWATSKGEADKRAGVLAELANELRKVPDGPELAPKILDRAATSTDAAELRRVRELVSRITAGKVVANKVTAPGSTFGDVANAWTSGKLAVQFPDHVKAKKTSGNDKGRLDLYVLPVVGSVPVSAFSLDHAEAVMRGLPSHLSPATRRQVAQAINRVIAMAVYPLRLIATSPLPRGWMPRVGKGAQKKQEVPTPPEHDAFVSSDAPLVVRLFAGFVAREGLRHEEAAGLLWRDLDRERGIVRLDENKTDDPRAWALRPGTARALRRWYVLQGKPDGNVPIFVDADGRALRITAADYRAHLLAAKIERAELHHGSGTTKPTGIHALRSLFVTEALARGENEAGVTDRTGPRSSQMVAVYKRRARTFREANMPPLGDLDVLLGWGPKPAPDRDPQSREDSSDRDPPASYRDPRVANGRGRAVQARRKRRIRALSGPLGRSLNPRIVVRIHVPEPAEVECTRLHHAAASCIRGGANR